MKCNRILFFFAGIAIFCITMCSVFYSRLNFQNVNETSYAARVFFFDLFFVEATAVILVGSYLLKLQRVTRLLFYCLLFCYCCITAFQVYSFYLGGEYVTRLAIENINHLSLLISTPVVISIAGAGLLFMLFVNLLERTPEACVSVRMRWITGLLTGCCIALCISPNWLSSSVQKEREEIATVNFIEYTSPLKAFYKTFVANRENTIQKKFKGLLPSEKHFLTKQGYTFNQGEEYPLLKETIYSGSLAIGDTVRSSQPNIIVFFTEGLSTKLLNAYEPDLFELTPNLQEFAQHSMRVENYYGHTWATYRGLLGQLCSIYPYYGGYGGWHSYYDKIVKPPYNSLVGVLKSEGYHTLFLDTHIQGKAYIDAMMGHVGFDEVIRGDQLSSRFLQNEAPLRDDSISDKQFYRSFVHYLKSVETSQTKPFFIGIYTLGTHAFRDMAIDGEAFGDGTNRVFNRIHSLDEAYGLFWRYFKQSPLAQNTIVIFTADHAPYMEKPYIEALRKVGEETTRPSFLDTIPLIVFDPTRELPEKYDAKVKTSIDFAPSLLHYLGVENRKNAFIGESIFETRENRKRQYGVISADHLMLIDNEGTFYTKTDTKGLNSTIKLFNKYVTGVKHYEVRRRIWPENKVQ